MRQACWIAISLAACSRASSDPNIDTYAWRLSIQSSGVYAKYVGPFGLSDRASDAVQPLEVAYEVVPAPPNCATLRVKQCAVNGLVEMATSKRIALTPAGWTIGGMEADLLRRLDACPAGYGSDDGCRRSSTFAVQDELYAESVSMPSYGHDQSFLTSTVVVNGAGYSARTVMNANPFSLRSWELGRTMAIACAWNSAPGDVKREHMAEWEESLAEVDAALLAMGSGYLHPDRSANPMQAIQSAHDDLAFHAQVNGLWHCAP